MQLEKKTCRCCGARTFQRYGLTKIDPFLLKYGLHIEMVALGSNPDQLKTLSGIRFEGRIAYGGCPACTFIAPWPALSDDMLLDFYSFYGSESYKRERIKYQPGYASIAAVHHSVEELALRREAHESFIVPHLEKYFSDRGSRQISMLDYNGTGAVTPRTAWIDVDIHDALDRSIQQVHRNYVGQSTTDHGVYLKYDIVQLMHVLQRVGDPREMYAKALAYAKPGGLIYVEVAWEVDSFQRMTTDAPPTWDEHIGKFSDTSVRALVGSLGGKIILCEDAAIPILYMPQSIRVVKCLVKV